MANIYLLKSNTSYGSNCYLIESGGEWAVIDPSARYNIAKLKYPDIAENLKYILLTHAHFDHILEIDSWIEACDNVMIGSGDSLALRDSYLNCYNLFLGVNRGYNGPVYSLNDKQKLLLGDEEITVYSFPGHTQGSVAFKIENSVFVGDLLFAGGSYGRTDLPSGSETEIFKSIKRFFDIFKTETIYPGHGESFYANESNKYFI